MSETSRKATLLVRIGQFCVDWTIDTVDCHMCERDEHGHHDEECPIGDYMREYPEEGKR